MLHRIEHIANCSPTDRQTIQTRTCVVSVYIKHVLDNKTIKGNQYFGFPLNNYGGRNIYSKVTIDECQYLCEITALCRYFNYGNEKCYLKFGVGKKHETNGYFGYKYSSGIKTRHYGQA